MTSRTSTGVRDSMILRQSILSRSVPTAREHRSAAIVLGEQHPLPKALARHRTVTHQTIVAVATAPAAALAVLAHIALGPVFLGASGSRRARVRSRLVQHRVDRSSTVCTS